MRVTSINCTKFEMELQREEKHKYLDQVLDTIFEYDSQIPEVEKMMTRNLKESKWAGSKYGFAEVWLRFVSFIQVWYLVVDGRTLVVRAANFSIFLGDSTLPLVSTPELELKGDFGLGQLKCPRALQKLDKLRLSDKSEFFDNQN